MKHLSTLALSAMLISANASAALVNQPGRDPVLPPPANHSASVDAVFQHPSPRTSPPDTRETPKPKVSDRPNRKKFRSPSKKDAEQTW